MAGGPLPRPNTSTRSGSPLAGSAQMSICATVEAGSSGLMRSPAAAMPATRRGASWLSRARDPASRSSRMASDGRHQVRGPGQPHRVVAEDLGQQFAARIPEVRRARRLVAVALPHIGQDIDAPAVRRGLPDPHPGDAVEQRGDVAEPVERGQPERRVAFRVAGVRQAAESMIRVRSAAAETWARSPAARCRWRAARTAPPRPPLPPPTGALPGRGLRSPRRPVHSDPGKAGGDHGESPAAALFGPQ